MKAAARTSRPNTLLITLAGACIASCAAPSYNEPPRPRLGLEKQVDGEEDNTSEEAESDQTPDNEGDTGDGTDNTGDETGETGDETGQTVESDTDPDQAPVDAVERAVELANCAAGDPDVDWSQATVLAQVEGQLAKRLYAFADDTNVHLCVEGDLPAEQPYELFIDSDGSAATGSSEGGWAPNGSEFKIVSGAPYAFAANAWTESTLAVTTVRGDHAITWVVSKQAAGLAPWFAVGFRLFVEGWSSAKIDRLPALAHHFARTQFPPTASAEGGMIIPTYALPPGIVDKDRTPYPASLCPNAPKGTPPENNAVPLDPAAISIAGTIWEKLAQGAAALQGAAYGDFWVAVNGPRHRPFQNADDFARAAVSYNPIVAAGGKLFGYVHTLEDPCDSRLRPMADVLADVETWVAGYPALSGIWIDEFYPQFDQGPVSGGAQRNPSGGYLQTLTDTIRAYHPELKLLGNAGGPVPSDQLLYSSLPDILCGFEQTHDEASKNDWARLALPSLLPDKPALLALVHAQDEATLQATVDRSLGHGYTYFYATDETLGSLWQRLPPYFDRMVSILAQRTGPSIPAND